MMGGEGGRGVVGCVIRNILKCVLRGVILGCINSVWFLGCKAGK